MKTTIVRRIQKARMFKLNIEAETDEEHNRIDPRVGKIFNTQSICLYEYSHQRLII